MQLVLRCHLVSQHSSRARQEDGQMEEKKSHSAMSSSSSSPSSSTSSLPFSAPVDIAKPSPSPTSQSQPQSKEKPTKSARKSIEKKSPTSGSAECLFAKASIRKCMKFNSDVHNISGMYVCIYICMYACMHACNFQFDFL